MTAGDEKKTRPSSLARICGPGSIAHTRHDLTKASTRALYSTFWTTWLKISETLVLWMKLQKRPQRPNQSAKHLRNATWGCTPSHHNSECRKLKQSRISRMQFKQKKSDSKRTHHQKTFHTHIVKSIAFTEQISFSCSIGLSSLRFFLLLLLSFFSFHPSAIITS